MPDPEKPAAERKITPAPPPAQPAEIQPAATPPAAGNKKGAARHPDPTRYGDWERGGRCIDF